MARKYQNRWTELKQRLVAWRSYENARFEVRNLSDGMLQDMGLSREPGLGTARSPWMN